MCEYIAGLLKETLSLYPTRHESLLPRAPLRLALRHLSVDLGVALSQHALPKSIEDVAACWVASNPKCELCELPRAQDVSHSLYLACTSARIEVDRGAAVSV